MFRSILRASLFAAVFATPGCAGATLGSGVGDRLVQRPPFYSGDIPVDETPVLHLPIGYQRGASQAPIFDPAAGPGTPIARLLADMNRYLDSIGVSSRIADLPQGTPPDVQFGCLPDLSGDCDEDQAGEVGRRQLRLAVGRPSAEWTAQVARALDRQQAGRVLVITLEIGQYFTRQRNLGGSKEVELGTDYAVSVPWLTSLESPVSVIQLTGALVGPDGKALRIGAEGLLARRTSLLASGEGLQALIRDEDLVELASRRREDLRGRPLVWQAGLTTLVRQLLGR